MTSIEVASSFLGWISVAGLIFIITYGWYKKMQKNDDYYSICMLFEALIFGFFIIPTLLRWQIDSIEPLYAVLGLIFVFYDYVMIGDNDKNPITAAIRKSN